MLLISLGPIQDFINSARRCQDLWFGSWLLSDLARAVGNAVQATVADAGGNAAACIIFPAGLSSAHAEEGAQERPGVSNLIFARLPAGLSPNDVASAAYDSVQQRLQDVSEQAFRKLHNDNNFKRDVAMAQIADLMELAWVSVPDTGAYQGDRDALYQRMAALKNTRRWAQPSWDPGRGVPKSSLDGERESVIDERIYNPRSSEFVEPTLRRQRYGVKKSERLCGVGLLKRRGLELSDDVFTSSYRRGRPPFHSTAHIAAGPTLTRLAKRPKSVAAALDALEMAGLDLDRFQLAEINGDGDGPPTLGGFDGNLLYTTRMVEHFAENARDEAAPGNIRDAERAIRQLLAEANCAEPSPYYAFLLADGDNMGAAIDSIHSAEGHQALAQALNDFALNCRGIVARHGGSLIFAGGDDVLALLPLHTALICARELAESFARALYPQVPSGVAAPTLSVGLAISHAREPMSTARELAKRAEKAAKSVPNKGALCVLLSRRSGGDLQVSGRWSQDAPPLVSSAQGPFAADARIQAWVKVVHQGGLSAKAAHDLEEVAAHFATLPPAELALRRDEATALCQQVLARKRRVGGGERNEGDPEVSALLGRIQWKQSSILENIRAISAELQLARLFAEAERQAGLASGSADDAQGAW